MDRSRLPPRGRRSVGSDPDTGSLRSPRGSLLSYPPLTLTSPVSVCLFTCLCLSSSDFLSLCVCLFRVLSLLSLSLSGPFLLSTSLSVSVTPRFSLTLLVSDSTSPFLTSCLPPCLASLCLCDVPSRPLSRVCPSCLGSSGLRGLGYTRER